jgi:hypothetical protein
MKKRYALAVLLVLLVAIALSASLVTADANATVAWTCGAVGCHDSAFPGGIHALTTHAATACGTCHTNGTGQPPTPAGCATCHDVPDNHTPAGGCFVADCHAAPPTPTPTPTPTDTPTPTPTPTDTSTPTPTPTPTATETSTPTPSPSATDDGGGGVGGVTDKDAESVGFPATGYPPSDGGSPWLLVTGAFAAGLALLLTTVKFRAAARRND